MLNLKGMLKTKKGVCTAASIGDLSAHDIIIAVMGPTGSGKSSFINMATGTEGDVGHSLSSCTRNISVVKHTLRELSDSDIYFVDTPGFDNSDPSLSDEVIGGMISGFLSTLSKKNIQLTALLYLHRISENRFTWSNLRSSYQFKDLCKEHLDNAVLATTMWNETDFKAGSDREAELKTYWKKIIWPREPIVKRFLHDHDSAIELLSSLVEKKNDMLLHHHMNLLLTSLHLHQTPASLYQFQNLVAYQQTARKKIRGQLRATTTDLRSFLGLLNECHKLSADLERALTGMKEENILFGGWFKKSIVHVDWGLYLRMFLCRKLQQKRRGSPGSESRAYDVALGGDTSLIRTVKRNSNGTIESGTLDGLIHILIEDFGAPDHIEYCDIFLQLCSEYLSQPKEGLGLLLHICNRFLAAESEQDDDNRIVTQYSILLALERWAELGCFISTEAALSQLKTLFSKTSKMNSTAPLKVRADNLLQLLEDGKVQCDIPMRNCLEHQKPVWSSTPEELAIALTLLESDHFKAIQPSDYMRRLTHPGSANPRIERYEQMNNTIKTWVIESILRYQDVIERLRCMDSFVKTAQACIEKGNFSSSTAIASALESDTLRNLQLTRRSLPPDSVAKLVTYETILNPKSKQHCYQEAIRMYGSGLRQEVSVPCLPIYLKELCNILRQNPMTVGKVDGQHLINFKRYTSFMHHIKHNLRFEPLNVDSQRSGELLDQLRRVDTSRQADRRRLERGRILRTREKVDQHSRTVQLWKLGFA